MKMAVRASLDLYVLDVLMADLVGHDRAPSAYLVYLKLWHLCGGPGRRGTPLSLQTLATETGVSKSSVQSAVRRLKRRGLIQARRSAPTAVPLYTVLTPWRRK
jgi:DNA-binding MarR family transcriptional regulator